MNAPEWLRKCYSDGRMPRCVTNGNVLMHGRNPIVMVEAAGLILAELRSIGSPYRFHVRSPVNQASAALAGSISMTSPFSESSGPARNASEAPSALSGAPLAAIANNQILTATQNARIRAYG